VEIDPPANQAGGGDRRIDSAASTAGVLVIASCEDRTIAAEVRTLLRSR
jgi:acetate kinase